MEIKIYIFCKMERPLLLLMIVALFLFFSYASSKSAESFAQELIGEINTPGLLSMAELDKLSQDLKNERIFNRIYQSANEDLYLEENAHLKKQILETIKRQRNKRKGSQGRLTNKKRKRKRSKSTLPRKH